MAFPGGVGEISITITPSDGTTTVTVHLAGPGGETLDPTPISTDGGATWVAYPAYTAAGEWIATWTVDGTGEGLEPQHVIVSHLPSPAATVAWRPDLWRVAAYIPRRTLVDAVDGYGTPRRTFDGDTMPSGPEVQFLITDACAWVLLAATPTEGLYPSALAAAAMRVAAIVELTYPDNGSDVNVAKDLLAQADAMRKDLAAAAVAAGGDDPATTADDLLPVWSFPAAPSWSDLDL